MQFQRQPPLREHHLLRMQPVPISSKANLQKAGLIWQLQGLWLQKPVAVFSNERKWWWK
ncbi:hypothetical protein PHLCEN_2v1640 [Hermanssonia centrifuga]|uniref:Uncharacterized protein n=1 Tax=Hermanssonia centrifuga TaxID=98765 RepID=A0A2R6RZM5_9APHY|nr:hypothetical protein PHLCEN_2v1640 [Hermanssonia centrifuga]